MSVRLAHREDGEPSRPAVFLAPSLGTTWEMFDDLAAALAPSYRVVRFDTRGHGRSPVPPGPYSVVELADDVLALADDLGVDRFGFVGVSLGGCIGQALALAHPDRLTEAVLCSTLPRFGEPAQWHERAATVRGEGMAALAEPTRARWFTGSFRAAHAEIVDHYIAMLTSTPTEGYAGCCDALASFDASEDLHRIDVPTRVVAGAEDPVATVTLGEQLAAAIPGADLVVIDDASHIAVAEQPGAFRAAVTEHLRRNQ